MTAYSHSEASRIIWDTADCSAGPTRRTTGDVILPLLVIRRQVLITATVTDEIEV
jgi:hypothetical protein